MARIKYSALLEGMSGKLNGSVFSHNRGTAYIRNKTKPSNPRTTAQVTVRNRFTGSAQAWRGLTAAQINAWNAGVGNYQHKNTFGDLKSPTGFNLYCKLNDNLKACAIAAITDCPLPVAVANVLTITPTVTVGTSTMSVAFTPTPVPALTAFQIRASLPLSPGRSFYKNKMRLIQVAAPAAASPTNIWAAYVLRFGAPVVGQKMFFSITPISTVTGQAGVPLTASCIVA